MVLRATEGWEVPQGVHGMGFRQEGGAVQTSEPTSGNSWSLEVKTRRSRKKSAQWGAKVTVGGSGDRNV